MPVMLTLWLEISDLILYDFLPSMIIIYYNLTTNQYWYWHIAFLIYYSRNQKKYRRCMSYTYRLIYGHFHISLVIIPRPPYWPETQSSANMGRGMITRPIWKCPCIKLFITYFRHLEKRHPYWHETKSRPILARANIGLDMEMIL